MKTPREILLAQHRAVELKLNIIRREAVEVSSDVNRRKQPVRELTFAATLANTIRLSFWELIWPCRRTWAALAAVWIALFIFNVSQRDQAELAARKLPPPSPEAIMAWRQQERLLAELIGPSAPGDAEQRKIFLPQPRSEGRMGNFL